MDVSLLIVDPDSDFASTVDDHLRATRPDWSMTHAPNLEAVERALAQGGFDAAVVHDRMGAPLAGELLAILQARQPDCVRLVLTAPHTLDGATELVSTCHRVLVEPCAPSSLCLAVEHARRLRDVLGRSGVRALGLRRRNPDSRRPTGDLLATV